MKKLRLALLGVVVAALVATSSAAAFTPTNPYYAKQWYLGEDNAFDAWDAPPQFDPVKVAIVDSGVDCSLPDFQGTDRQSEELRRRQRLHRQPGARHDRRRRDRRFAERAVSSVSPTRPSCSWPRSSPPTARSRSRPRRPASAGRSTRARASSTSASAQSAIRSARSRHVLEGRGAGGRIRCQEGSGRRRGRRELGRGAHDAVAVRELAGGAAARDRRRCSDSLRQRARLLGPRSDLRRHRCAGRRHLLHLPEGA